MRLAPSTVALLAAALTACTSPPKVELPQGPAQWHAPLPHDGDAAALADWWRRFDDPLLAALIDDAQRSNPTLVQAQARIQQARAGLRAAQAARWPSVDATALASREHSELPPLAATLTRTSIGADAAWEIDLFGGVRHAVTAATARADGSEFAWHDARVSLAADTALAYIGLRACESLVAVLAQEAESQAKTAELTRAKVKAGFDAPANGALAGASAAEAANRLGAQRADCDIAVKALVVLTGVPEPQLRDRMVADTAKLPQSAPLAVPAVPAQVLSQRPDLAAAERELVAAAAEVGVADAQRYPRLALTGTIGVARLHVGGVDLDGTNWSFGPLLTLPLFDAGRRAAGVDAARARFDEARASYELRARLAVREVEEALVRVAAATSREADAQRAAQGYRDWFLAAQSRWEIGAGSLVDMEDARRLYLVAQASLIAVQRERASAAVALYRAVGGGWESPATTQSKANP